MFVAFAISSSFLSRMLLLRILYRFIWLKTFGQAIRVRILSFMENDIRGIFFILSFSNIISLSFLEK